MRIFNSKTNTFRTARKGDMVRGSVAIEMAIAGKAPLFVEGFRGWEPASVHSLANAKWALANNGATWIYGVKLP